MIKRLSTVVVGVVLIAGLLLAGLSVAPRARAATQASQWLFFPFVPHNTTIAGTGPWSGSITVQNLEDQPVVLRVTTTAAPGSSGTLVLPARGQASYTAAELGVPVGGGGVAISATWQTPSATGAAPRVTGVLKQAAPASASFRGTTDGSMQMVDGYAALAQADVPWGAKSVFCGGSTTSRCNDLAAVLEGLPASVRAELEFTGQSFLPIVQANWFGWQTVIQLTNVDASASSAQAKITFYGSSQVGNPALGPVTLTVAAGQTTTIDVAAQLASLGFNGPFVGSAVIESDYAFVASATRVKAATSMALSTTATPLPWVGVDLSGSRLEQSGARAHSGYTLFAPLVFHNYNGWNTGINIANVSGSANTVTVTVYDRNGIRLGTYSRTIEARGMEYVYIPEVSTLAANDFGTAVLTGTQPFHAVVDEVKYATGEAMAFLAIPANARAGVSRTGALGIPLYQKGLAGGAHGDTSGLNLFNPGGGPVSGTVTFYNQAGVPIGTRSFSLNGFGTTLVYSPDVTELADGLATSAVVRATGGTGVVSAVSNVVNYDVAADGGAVFNVTNPLGQFRLSCTDSGCGYVLSASDGSLRVVAPWNGGEPSNQPASLELSLSPTGSISVDNKVTVRALVKDALGAVMPDVTVTFTVTGSNAATASPKTGSVTTNAQGIATFEYGQTKPGTDKVLATVEGLETEEIEVTWVPGAPKTVELTPDKTTQTVGEPVTFTATVKDQHGNLIPNVDVTFATDADSAHPSATGSGKTGNSGDALGKATFTFKDGKKAGTDTWTARVGSGSSAVTSEKLTVTWKAGDPAKVELSAKPNSLTVGGSTTLTATVKDRFDNLVPDVGVTFKTDATSVHENQSHTTTTGTSGAALGLATYTFQDQNPLGTGDDRWTATAANGVSSNQVTVTWNPDAPDSLALAADKTNPIVGETVTFTATVKDKHGNPIPGLEVTFATTGSANVHNDAEGKGTTNASGVATYQFTDDTPQGTGTDTWTASIADGPSDSVNIQWRAGSPATIQLTASATSPKAGETVTLTATVYDANNNVVDWFGDNGEVVNFHTTAGVHHPRGGFSTATGGVATLTISETTVGQDTWEALRDGVTSNTVNINWQPGDVAKIALKVNPASQTVGQSVTFTAELQDGFGNRVDVGNNAVVTFTVTEGPLSGLTNSTSASNGMATMSYGSGQKQAGQQTWKASYNGVDSNEVTVTWLADAPAQVVLEVDNANPTVAVQIKLTAKVLDANGNPVTNASGTVTFETIDDAVSQPSVHAGARGTADLTNGQATWYFTGGTKAGVDRWQATVAGVGSDTVDVTWGAGPAAHIELTTSATNDTATAGTAVTLTATVKDQWDNVVTGQVGKIRFSQTGTPANPNAGGDVDLTNGTATLPYTGTKAGQDQWQAQLVVDGSVVGDVTPGQATVTWVAGDAAKLVVTPNTTLTRTVGQNARLIATVLDQHDNPVQGVNVTFTLTATTRTGVTASSELKTAASNAQGRVILDYTAANSGTDTIEVTSGSLTAVQRTVTWTPGPVQTIEVAFSPNPPTAGQNVTVSATLKDANGNAVPNVPVRLMSVPGSHNSVDLTATTDASGVASFTYTGAVDSAEKTDTLWALASGDGGSVIVSDPLQITWTGPAPDSITLSVSKANPTADDTSVELTATLYAGTMVASWIDSGNIEFAVTNPKSTPNPATDASGKVQVAIVDGVAKITLAGNQAGTESWSATYVDNSNVTGATLGIDWAAGAVKSVTLEVRTGGQTPGAWSSTGVTVPYDETNNNFGTVEFRVTATDGHNNPVPGATVSLNITGGNAGNSTTGLTVPSTDLNGQATVAFPGTYAGYDDWQASVGTENSSTVRVTWAPFVGFTANNTSVAPSTSVSLTLTIEGFQCSTLFDAGQANQLGQKVLFLPDTSPTTETFGGWSCSSPTSGPEVATATWTVSHNSQASINFTVRLKLDGNDALDPTIGEVEKSVTVTWGP